MAVLGLRKMFRLQRYILVLLFASFILGMVLGISLVSNSESSLFGILHPGHKTQDATKRDVRQLPPPEKQVWPSTKYNSLLQKKLSGKQMPNVINSGKQATLRSASNHQPKPLSPRPLLKVPIEKSRSDEGKLDHEESKVPEPSYKVHAFYYPWYGNPEFDKVYLHWNHVYISHWDKKEASKWPKGQHTPPDDVGSNFYPELGPYSSRNPEVMNNHMQQLRAASVGVLAVSWYPPRMSDENGRTWDDLMTQLMDTAHKYNLKVCFHIEPYKGRNYHNMRENIEYIVGKYGAHPAMYTLNHKGQDLPLYYIYDSYLVPKDEWARLLLPDGDTTVRNTLADGIFIGLVVEERHKTELQGCGFDGYYTYFASDGFTYGSSTRNWLSLAQFAHNNNMLFIPSVGPGYADTRIRPWNARNTKEREHGGYFEQSFRAAIGVKPAIVSITSFNEWGEGTQIEKAVPKTVGRYKYQDYTPQRSDYYLMLTRKWVHKYTKLQNKK